MLEFGFYVIVPYTKRSFITLGGVVLHLWSIRSIISQCFEHCERRRAKGFGYHFAYAL